MVVGKPTLRGALSGLGRGMATWGEMTYRDQLANDRQRRSQEEWLTNQKMMFDYREQQKLANRTHTGNIPGPAGTDIPVYDTSSRQMQDLLYWQERAQMSPPGESSGTPESGIATDGLFGPSGPSSAAMLEEAETVAAALYGSGRQVKGAGNEIVDLRTPGMLDTRDWTPGMFSEATAALADSALAGSNNLMRAGRNVASEVEALHPFIEAEPEQGGLGHFLGGAKDVAGQALGGAGDFFDYGGSVAGDMFGDAKEWLGQKLGEGIGNMFQRQFAPAAAESIAIPEGTAAKIQARFKGQNQVPAKEVRKAMTEAQAEKEISEQTQQEILDEIIDQMIGG